MISDTWNSHFINESPLFGALAEVYPWQAHTNWPTIADYNNYLAQQNPAITNHQGQPLRCILQTNKSTEFIHGYEPSMFLRGELLTRPHNWHDFFNLLVWLTFPKIKAALNHWQYQYLSQRLPGQVQRTAIENKLTHLDENGVIVITSNARLAQLLCDQEWETLFWRHREQVTAEMRFIILGHALYEKALHPYIGMTGSAIILELRQTVLQQPWQQQCDIIDTEIQHLLLDQTWLAQLTKLVPVPILGVPGWWQANEQPHFYHNTQYFRPKRNITDDL